MILPNKFAGGAIAVAPAPEPVPVHQEALHALQAACAGCAFFHNYPSADTARQAIAVLQAWDGPLASRVLPEIIRMLSPRRASAAAVALLNLYLVDCVEMTKPEGQNPKEDQQ